MRAGPMRERVTQKRTPIANNGGTAVGEPVTVGPAPDWANVQDARPGNIERVFGAHVGGIATHLVEMRFRDVRNGDLILWHDTNQDRSPRDRILSVVGVTDPDQRKRRVLIATVEVVES